MTDPVTMLRQRVKDLLREIENKQDEVRRTREAIRVLGGGKAPGGRARPQPVTQMALEWIDSHPDERFGPKEIQAAGVPEGGTARLLRRLLRDKKVRQVGETARGTPIVQSKRSEPKEPKPAQGSEPTKPPKPEAAKPGSANGRKARAPGQLPEDIKTLMADGRDRDVHMIARAMGTDPTALYKVLHQLVDSGDLKTWKVTRQRSNGASYETSMWRRRHENRIKPGEGVEKGRVIA